MKAKDLKKIINKIGDDREIHFIKESGLMTESGDQAMALSRISTVNNVVECDDDGNEISAKLEKGCVELRFLEIG